MTVIQNFLVPAILLQFKLLKYCFFSCFRAFTHLFLCFFVILPVYSCAGPIKFITQFRRDFFSKAFCHEMIVVISDLLLLMGANAIFPMKSEVVNLVLKYFVERVLIILFIATKENMGLALAKVFLKLRK